jgi:hypothetical protein
MAYECTWYCYQHASRPYVFHNDVERHPVAFPAPPARCLWCNKPMVLGTFALIVATGSGAMRHQRIRNMTRKGELPLFPDFQG